MNHQGAAVSLSTVILATAEVRRLFPHRFTSHRLRATGRSEPRRVAASPFHRFALLVKNSRALFLSSLPCETVTASLPRENSHHLWRQKRSAQSVSPVVSASSITKQAFRRFKVANPCASIRLIRGFHFFLLIRVDSWLRLIFRENFKKMLTRFWHNR